MAFLQLLLCSILLLLSTISFSQAKTKPCNCPGSNQEVREQRRNYTMDAADVVFLVNNQSGFLQMPLHKVPDTDANNTRVLSTIHGLIELRRNRPDGLGVDESSFNITIVIRNQTTTLGSHESTRSVLSFLILPGEALQVNGSLSLAKQLLVLPTNGYQLNLTKPTYQMGYVSDREVYIATGLLGSPARTGHDNGKHAMGVDIIIRPPASSYSAWIDYDRVRRWLAVYVDMEGMPKPASAIAEGSFNISSGVSPTSPFVYFGILSTLEQRRSTGGIHFGATVEDLPDYHLNGSFLSKKVTVLSSILGSVAISAVMAMAVMCYFNSRYRRWHKELKQLAKSMERLPGVPTKVDFADIKKATFNFRETMKLGGGGFGTVYRCTLPATASKMDRPMDVAVKRFTRDVQNHRYNDFLAEVSIINGLGEREKSLHNRILIEGVQEQWSYGGTWVRLRAAAHRCRGRRRRLARAPSAEMESRRPVASRRRPPSRRPVYVA